MRKAVAILVLAALLPACAKRAGELSPPTRGPAEASAAKVERDSEASAGKVPEFGRSTTSTSFEKTVGIILVLTVSLAAAAGLGYLSYVVIPDLIH